jgi:type IV secretory pathway VirB4 component
MNDRRFSHTWVIGKTGVGKSTALVRWAVDDIMAGDGIAFFDPHGGAADMCLGGIEHLVE